MTDISARALKGYDVAIGPAGLKYIKSQKSKVKSYYLTDPNGYAEYDSMRTSIHH